MKLITWNVQWCRGVDGKVDAGAGRRGGASASPISTCSACRRSPTTIRIRGWPGSAGEDQFALLRRAAAGLHGGPGRRRRPSGRRRPPPPLRQHDPVAAAGAAGVPRTCCPIRPTRRSRHAAHRGRGGGGDAVRRRARDHHASRVLLAARNARRRSRRCARSTPRAHGYAGDPRVDQDDGGPYESLSAPGRDDHHRRLQPRTGRSAARADGGAVRRRHAAAGRRVGASRIRACRTRRRCASTRRSIRTRRRMLRLHLRQRRPAVAGCDRGRRYVHAGLRSPAGDRHARADARDAARRPCGGAAPSRRPRRADTIPGCRAPAAVAAARPSAPLGPNPASAAAATLTFTGERFLPEVRGPIWYEHWHRYAPCGRLAARQARARRGVRRRLRQLPARARAAAVRRRRPPAAIVHARARYARRTCVRRRLGDSRCRCPTRASTSSCRSRRSSISRAGGDARRVPPRAGARTACCVISSPNRPGLQRRRRRREPLPRARARPRRTRGAARAAFPRQAWYAQRVIAQSALWAEGRRPARAVPARWPTIASRGDRAGAADVLRRRVRGRRRRAARCPRCRCSTTARCPCGATTRARSCASASSPGTNSTRARSPRTGWRSWSRRSTRWRARAKRPRAGARIGARGRARLHADARAAALDLQDALDREVVARAQPMPRMRRNARRTAKRARASPTANRREAGCAFRSRPCGSAWRSRADDHRRHRHSDPRRLEALRRCVDSVLAADVPHAATKWSWSTMARRSRARAIPARAGAAAARPSSTQPGRQGFAAAVNRAFGLHRDRDVVVLHSDAEVANDWLDRLARHAAARDVGVVGTFTNNVGTATYPLPRAANPLPAGQTVATLDALFARANPGRRRRYRRSTARALYFRRECLRAVGRLRRQSARQRLRRRDRLLPARRQRRLPPSACGRRVRRARGSRVVRRARIARRLPIAPSRRSPSSIHRTSRRRRTSSSASPARPYARRVDLLRLAASGSDFWCSFHIRGAAASGAT